MKKETVAILEGFKSGKLSVHVAQRKLFVLFGVSRTEHCALDRLPKDCCIIKHTSLETCDGCGHYYNNV